MKNLQVKDKKGITLVALVITIVILIILAVVAINAAFGDSGLIEQAEKAADYQANAEATDSKLINDATDYLEELLGSGENQDPNDTIPTDGSFSTEKGVNTPKIASDMKLVTFNTNTNTWEEDTTNSGYSYIDTSVEGNTDGSEWANAEVKVNNVTSYFVWVPRYAYRIVDGVIDVKFIKGTGKETVDGIQCKYASENPIAGEDYIIHPAFTQEEDYGGGWENELPGI